MIVSDPATQRWYRHAVIYCVDVDSYQDSDGDGWGDLHGLTSRLGHLARLGVTCLWLNPIHPTPNRDDGYDVSDYYGVDPRLGSSGDLVELVQTAADYGIRVILDLVINHTSNQHPWFRAACESKDSPFRDWYVWSDTEPPDIHQGVVFPGEQDTTWSFDEKADAWFFHRFYDFQPDLNWSNPLVRAEMLKVLAYWLQVGIAGFRVDAAPFVLEQVQPGVDPGPLDFAILDQWRQHLQWKRSDAVLIGEANVSPQDVPKYFGSGPTQADRMHMLFDFTLNPRLFLALARREAEPLLEGLRNSPPRPMHGQWATFLRNHDELDLSRLTQEQRAEVFAAFGPQKRMHLFERGIRRRLAPMLGNDRRHLELAYSLQFSMPGTPVLRYGEEIGMGENLDLRGRDAFRTPMQWDAEPNAGFSTADPKALVRPVIDRGEYDYRRVNVMAQRTDPDSLLTWFQRLISVRRECPEIGAGTVQIVDQGFPPGVVVHRADAASGSLLLVHNLADEPAQLDLEGTGGVEMVEEVFADGMGDPLAGRLGKTEVAPYGYRWIRIARRPLA